MRKLTITNVGPIQWRLGSLQICPPDYDKAAIHLKKASAFAPQHFSNQTLCRFGIYSYLCSGILKRSNIMGKIIGSTKYLCPQNNLSRYVNSNIRKILAQ